VALDPPRDVRESLAAWRDAAIVGREDLRPVPVEALHVTLAFLGSRPAGDVERIGTVLAGVAERFAPPELEARGIKPIPARRPRLFALDLADPSGGAASIQLAVSDGLVGIYTSEERPFWPHITLARVRKGAKAPLLDAPPPPADGWRAEAVTLYRSQLSPRGARYEALARARLG
jgi:2'-5' RNA ligase